MARGRPIAYEQMAGRAFGELDPELPGNAIIQDIELAKDADGKVRYVASFVIYRPVDRSQASGLMWHDVPNRGRVVCDRAARARVRRHHAGQRLAGRQRRRHRGAADGAALAGLQWLHCRWRAGPAARAITGEVFARIVNRSGPASQPLLVQTNPVPYRPLSLDTTKAKLVSRGGENQRGEVIDEVVIPPPTGRGRAAMPPIHSPARRTRRRSV